MDKVTIEISAKWQRLVKSPLMWVIWSLQGVAITFAPLFIYWSGSGKFFPGISWWAVPLCFALVFLIPAFYFWLGAEVIRELRKRGSVAEAESP